MDGDGKRTTCWMHVIFECEHWTVFPLEVEEDRGKGQAVRAVASQSTAVAGTVSRGRWRDRELLGGVGLKRQLPSWRGQYPPGPVCHFPITAKPVFQFPTILPFTKFLTM